MLVVLMITLIILLVALSALLLLRGVFFKCFLVVIFASGCIGLVCIVFVRIGLFVVLFEPMTIVGLRLTLVRLRLIIIRRLIVNQRLVIVSQRLVIVSQRLIIRWLILVRH